MNTHTFVITDKLAYLHVQNTIVVVIIIIIMIIIIIIKYIIYCGMFVHKWLSYP